MPDWLKRAQDRNAAAKVDVQRRRDEFLEQRDQRQLARSPGGGDISDRSQLHRDANKLLDENLIAGEGVSVIIRGVYDSAMIGTDRRVFVFKKGWLSGSTFAKKLATYDYLNLTGLQVETGVMTGSVTLQGPGIVSMDMGNWDGGKNVAREAPYALMVNSQHYAQVKRAAPKLRELISNAQGGRAVSAAPEGPLDQLRKLGELRDGGVLTVTEFETKKAEILARL